MKNTHKIRVLVCVLSACLLSITACGPKNSDVTISSQKIVSADGTSSITGQVVDDRGGPLPGVSVVLESPGTAAQTINTSAKGVFNFYNVPPGEYSVNFALEGFSEVRQEAVRVGDSMGVQLAIVLKISLAEEFTVVGETPMIDTRKSGMVETYRPSDYRSQGRRKKTQKNSSPSTMRLPAEFQDADELIVVEQSTVDFNDSSYKPIPPKLETHTKDGKEGVQLPLKQTDVEAEISGFVARTTVVQVYSNSRKEPVEAVYSFPLPTRAAVYDFVMEIEGRRIVGIVRPKEEAQKIYTNAKEQGFTASLLTQDRPNFFTQNVANIPAQGVVSIRISYFERLMQESGSYEYVFPAVVGERYNPRSDASTDEKQAIDSRSKTASPEKSSLRLTSSNKNFLNLKVDLNAGVPIEDLKSAAHKVDVQEISSSHKIIQISQELPNRDFVLRWRVGSDRNESSVLTHATNGDGYFVLVIQSPAVPAAQLIVPREITFILDISGSMSGIPLDVSREVIERTMDQMRGSDLFNIIFFSGDNNQLWEDPQPAIEENLKAARNFLKNLEGGGGTEMLPALRRALSAKHDPRYLQMYAFLTDGFVGNEDEILRVIGQEKGDARFFAFGIGSSVNRYLIEGIGAKGNGLSCVVLPRDEEHAEKAASWFFKALDAPVLTNVQIDWQGLPVEKTYPKNLKDLFAGHAIEIIGKFNGPASGTILISGRSGMESVRYSVPVVFPAEENANKSLALLYARQKIEELSNALLVTESDKQEKIINQITELSMKTGLVSQYTAFVAVDESRVVSDGKPIKIIQPLEKSEGSFGGNGVQMVRVEKWGMVLSNDKDGVHINAVEGQGTAAKSGIQSGTRIKRINRTGLYDLEQLEGLLLQAGGSVVELELEPGGKFLLPLP